MSTIEHSTITDPNLHEPKGVAAATDGQIYVADGSGSGVWTDPGDLSFSVGPAGSFSEDLFVAAKETLSVILTGSTWTSRPATGSLTTLVNNIASASVSTNTLSLPSGTYYVEGFTTAYSSTIDPTLSVVRLYNVTNSASLAISSATVSTKGLGTGGASISGMGGACILNGYFTISGTKTIALQSYVTSVCTAGSEYVAAIEAPTTVSLHIWKIS